MPAYRSYLIGALGHVEGVEIISAADDVAAIKAVALGQDAKRRDLWCGGRLVKASALVKRPAQILAPRMGREMKHALIIEDHALIALTIADELRDCGYATIDIAASQDEAIRMAEEKCPDLITVDKRLNAGCGIAAIRHICRDKAIPVVFITADTMPVSLAIPDAVILEKPFFTGLLSTAIPHAVKGARIYT